MRLEQEQVEIIRTMFQQIKSKNDLLKLINFAKKLLFGEAAYAVPLKTLTYYGNTNLASDAYRTFSIRKKSGGKRTIHAPVKGLKPIQKALNLILQCLFTPHHAANGFVPERSIVDNAKVHQGAHYVYNIDIKDFFPSIDLSRVAACLRLPPFNLIDTTEEPLAFLVANLCCTPILVERQNESGEWINKTLNVLPQGAPTSPIITNIVAQRLDKRLTGIARRFGANFSRYADDITFSSMHNIYKQDDAFTIELTRIIESQGFHINPSKTRLQKTGFRQEVTGLVVNEKVNVHRRYVKQIRHWLYLWERYGYAQAEQIFKREYVKDKGYAKKGNPKLENVLEGKLLFMKMVKGGGDGTFLGLWRRFEGLVNAALLNESLSKNEQNIVEILQLWENEGIEAAEEKFNQLELWKKED
jgi:retron-type reverse transcriptase